MSYIRPLAGEDIPALVALRARCFTRSAQPSIETSGRYFEAVFLRSPFLDPQFPSLVYRDRAGEVVGFLGVLTRRMLFRGEPLRMTVSTQLMVDPAARGIPGIELLRTYFAGGQDLSFADTATSTARALWERFGGKPCYLQSLDWQRTLRPWRHAVGQRVRGLPGRLAARALRPVLELADRRAVRNPRDAAALLPPTVSAAPFQPSRVIALLDEIEGSPALRPVYDVAGLEWLLAEAGRRSAGPLRSRLVMDSAGAALGWYGYQVNRGGVAEVIHLGAVKGRTLEVLDLLFEDAWRQGVVALRGRLEPCWLPGLAARQCTLLPAGAWTLVHSRRPDLVAAILAGDAMLSRLEGEWWLNF